MRNENKEYSRDKKITRKEFREFLEKRYGKWAAEKWQNLFEFGASLSFDDYQKKLVSSVLLQRDILSQIAFDFYDANNDEKISEIDLFKVINFYGEPHWNPHCQPKEKKPARAG
jgi:Ca2+-binding EF-hand superfamily protein